MRTRNHSDVVSQRSRWIVLVVTSIRYSLWYWITCTATEENLTHWDRMTHICVGNLTIIVSDNGLAPGRRQAIIWNNAGILLIGILGTNFSEILSEICTFSLKKIHLNMSSPKWRPFCRGLYVLNDIMKTHQNMTKHTLGGNITPWYHCVLKQISKGQFVQDLVSRWI